MTTMGARIASVRSTYKLSQAEFASKIGVSRSYLSEVENEKGKPSIEMVVGIATTFPAISLDWLLTGEGGRIRLEKDEGGKRKVDFGKLRELLAKGEDEKTFSPSQDDSRPLNKIEWPLTSAQERLLEYFVPISPVPGNIPFINPFIQGANKQLQVHMPYALTRSWVEEMFDCEPEDLFLYQFRTNDFEPIIKRGSHAFVSTKEDKFNGAGYYLMANKDFLEMWYISGVSGKDVIGTTKAPLDAAAFRRVNMEGEQLSFGGRVVWLAMAPHSLPSGAEAEK